MRPSHSHPTPRITRDDLAALLAETPTLHDLDLIPADYRMIIDALTTIIRDQVQGGAQVQVFGWGSFSSVSIPARKVRNARIGEWVKVPAKIRYRWTPGTDWKVSKRD